ncbi:sensor histidine kinase [Croceiramulus getboli]|nr:HAMP domain-containing sensor histidine kinase [Flavobacteriaceae bacterium YJPT1-3]
MNRRLFVFLVVLMSLSLIGIIFVQGYWISNSVETKREQFAFNAKQVLISTANKIQNQELEEYYYPLRAMADSIGIPDDISIQELFLIEEDSVSNQTYLYSNSIIEQDFKLGSPATEYDLDSIKIKKYISRKVAQVFNNNSLDGQYLSSQKRLELFSNMDELSKLNFQEIIFDQRRKIPIHKRIPEGEIERIMIMELAERDMETDFEYAVHSNSLATQVRSENFDLQGSSRTYSVPLFVNKDGLSDYQLLANFPGEKEFVLSSIFGMAALSIIFTLIIVIAYSSALQQLIRQRQISQIKTDFINNMTHEFKTPIATINLALDAIKNPLVSADETKVKRYLGMIKEENKRMHAQVENVLRISKLERNELDIKKERLDLHDLVDDAISHISLIVEDRQGYIETHLDAERTAILANDSHFTNVLVNILDNAVKYSEESPKIDIYTENARNFVILKIQDQGIGMSKTAQKQVFEKFYRAHTGDVHNVKGHGLGLAYVKRIVEDHHGEISVESERGKGSTFIIKLPLIT